MLNSLAEQVAVVTGAGRGIGRAVSQALATAGAKVFCLSRSEEPLQQTVAAIRAGGKAAHAVVCDVADQQSVVQAFATVEAAAGRLDVLVNNAGIGLFGPIAEFAVADFDRLYAVNLRGTFLCCQEALRRMIPRKSGYLINVSSVVGFKGYVNQAAYTSTKHGVMGLTKVLAAEAQPHGIRASVILPGGVDTDMVAQARPDLDRSILLRPEDIAETVLYLLSLSDRASVDEIYIRRRTSQPF